MARKPGVDTLLGLPRVQSGHPSPSLARPTESLAPASGMDPKGAACHVDTGGPRGPNRWEDRRLVPPTHVAMTRAPGAFLTSPLPPNSILRWWTLLDSNQFNTCSKRASP